MKRHFLLILTAVTTTSLSFSQEVVTLQSGKKILLFDNGSWTFADSNTLYNLQPANLISPELPKPLPGEIVVSHAAYTLSFNKKHRQANWVAYELTSEETQSAFERTNKFHPDPDIKETAADNDFSGSGFDRGHLAPASDMGWSSTAMEESFYYSNVSPQVPGFNRGIWKRLEELVRTWAVENKSVYIVTGGILTNGLLTIGNNVSVPEYFYKVILDYKEPGVKGIGFILPNAASSGSLQSYALTIDSVEKFAGIDFFPLLPDGQENIIEGTLSLTSWVWKSSESSNKTGSEKASVSVQCSGLTKAGARCRNKTLNQNGYCYLHQGQISSSFESPGSTIIPEQKRERRAASVQCSATTKKGSRCKRMTYSSNGYCWQHGGN